MLRYTPEEAIDNTLNHLDYFIGNSKGIAKSLLREANLPEGMTEKQALELVTKGLNEKVYNGHTNLVTGGNFFKNVNDVALKIMSDNGIIANQNNTNLLKAETTYFMNLTCLKDIQKSWIKIATFLLLVKKMQKTNGTNLERNWRINQKFCNQ